MKTNSCLTVTKKQLTAISIPSVPPHASTTQRANNNDDEAAYDNYEPPHDNSDYEQAHNNYEPPCIDEPPHAASYKYDDDTSSDSDTSVYQEDNEWF